MKKHKYIFIILFTLIVIAAMGMSFYFLKNKYQKDTEQIEEIAYELPIIIPSTGRLSYIAEPAEWAAKYAQDEINAAGGIHGVPVKVIFYDSEFNENQTKIIEQKIVDEQRFFIGPLDSVGTAACADIVKESGTPNLAAYSYPLIRNQTAPYGISYMSDSTEGEEATIQNWKKLNPDIEKVVVIINKGDNSQLETAGVLQEKLPGLDMMVSDIIPIDLSENNGLNAVVEILNAKADGYIILARSEEYGNIISELRKWKLF